MTERIYCPKCEGTEHKLDYTALRRTYHWSICAMQFLQNTTVRFSWLTNRVLLRHRPSEDTKEESYVPEGFYCLNCRHHFLSSHTYQNEIEWTQKFKRSGLIMGFLHFFLAALFLSGFLFLDKADLPDHRVLFYCVLTVFFMICSFAGFCCAVASSRIAKRMTAEWKEFSTVQASHQKTVHGSAKEQLPTWKRLQLETEACAEAD